MASPFAARLYLLTGGERSLIGGLPYSLKPWHPNSLPRPFQPKFGAKVACYTSNGECLGACNFEHGTSDGDKADYNVTGLWNRKGWRFYPNPTCSIVGKHTRGQKFHSTYKECIPVWATPLITKWVLVD
jgi:hypothetical protein